MHVLTTRVRKLYRCQVVIVRQSLDAPLSQARSWASSDLQADLPTLLVHIATRWEIEVLFGDGKEELGVDQYQLMSATAIVRFWTLAMLAYVFLEEERDRLQTQWQRHVTIGEARRAIQRRQRRHMLDWLHRQFQSGVQPDDLVAARESFDEACYVCTALQRKGGQLESSNPAFGACFKSRDTFSRKLQPARLRELGELFVTSATYTSDIPLCVN